MPPTTELLTLAEAAVVLRCTRWKLYQLMRTDGLPYVTVGARRLIPAEGLRDYLTSRLAPAPAPPTPEPSPHPRPGPRDPEPARTREEPEPPSTPACKGDFNE